MELDIPHNDGLQPEGRKHNPLETPKPETRITDPKIVAQMPGPKPLSMESGEEVKKWLKTRGLAQASSQQESFELSSEHRHYRFDQIDTLRPTVYGGAAAVIFRYQDRTTGEVQIVIVKLDRRDDAIQLARAIAWRLIQAFPYGQYVADGTDSDLKDSPPFNPAACVDNYFRQQVLTQAKATLAADQAAIARPLRDANGKIADQAKRESV